MTAALRTYRVGDEELAALHFGADAPARPLVLLLHGFPDHPPSFAALAHLLEQAGYRCVAPYLRGYAPSTLRGPCSLERLRDDVLALLEQLSPDQPAALLGHDWGAVVTYAVCAAAPARVRRAVTLSVPTPLAFLRQLVTSGQLARSWYMLLFQPRWADALVARRDFAFVDWLWRRWSPALTLDQRARAELHACLAASWPAPLAPYRALLAPRGLAARARELARWRIEVPLLQLHGERDGCIAAVPLAQQRGTLVGPAEQRLLPGCGHFLQLENPEALARLVVRWLA